MTVSDRQKPPTAVDRVLLPREPTNRMLAIINSHISLLNHNPTANETYTVLLAEAERNS